MDKMFDSSFRYGFLSFPLHDTSSRFVVFRVLFTVLRSRLIASGVRHLVSSIRRMPSSTRRFTRLTHH